jgi:hypothetical protein
LEEKKLVHFLIIFQEFTANDHSHHRSEEIHAKSNYITDVLIQYGYECSASCITRPLRPHETIQSVLASHSERLAIAYHFIQEQKPSFIQITKNLRMCEDCRKLLFDLSLSFSINDAFVF